MKAHKTVGVKVVAEAGLVHMTTALGRWRRMTVCGSQYLFADSLTWGEAGPVTLLTTTDVSQVTCPQCIDHLANEVAARLGGSP